MANRSKDRLGSRPTEPLIGDDEEQEDRAPAFENLSGAAPLYNERDDPTDSGGDDEIDRGVKRDQTTRDEQRQGIAAEQDRQFTDDEYLEAFLSTFANSALPQLPPIPGFHYCWLSTTNSKDTIHSRLRIGYQLVKPGEVPGYENLALNNGEYAGYIGVNEMVLAKLPDTLFQRYMQHLHHKLPLEEAAKLRYRAETLKEEAQGYGADVEIGGGIKTIEAIPRPRVRQMFER